MQMRMAGFVLFCLLIMGSHQVYGFSGSLGLNVDQRYFQDERLGPLNGFSSIKPEFEVVFGLADIGFRIEPVVAFSYLRSSSPACAVEEDGFTCLEDEAQVGNQDAFEYRILKFATGAQWKAWEPSFFFIIPRAFVHLTYRRSWINKVTADEEEKTSLNGGDFEFDVGGGALISFMYSQRRRAELETEWDLKDFGLSLHSRYIFSNLYKHGLGGVRGTGGWSFGAGLFLDW